MQLSALRNVIPDSDDAKTEYLRVVNEMRVNGEGIDESIRSEVFQIYYSAFNGDVAEVHRFLGGLQAAQQVVTFKQLFDTPEFARDHPTRDLYLAVLQEAAGQNQEALRTLAEFKRNLPPGSALNEQANRVAKGMLGR